jgi:hypothetical protein
MDIEGIKIPFIIIVIIKIIINNITFKIIIIYIQGSEFQVLPTMLTRGSLCLISGMSVEWHFSLNRNAPRNFDDILYFITSNSYDCDFWVFNEDDETYMNNEEPIPDFPGRLLHLYGNILSQLYKLL